VKIAAWNVNSIRARLPVALAWLDQARPDVALVQETKVTPEQFPAEPFEERGYNVAAANSGQGTSIRYLIRNHYGSAFPIRAASRSGTRAGLLPSPGNPEPPPRTLTGFTQHSIWEASWSPSTGSGKHRRCSATDGESVKRSEAGGTYHSSETRSRT
jgi:hypothetical protein